MDKKDSPKGKLVDFIGGITHPEEGFTGAQIAAAYKAALSDFVLRKTSRSAVAEVTRLLGGALAARKQEIAESEDRSGQHVRNYY